MLLRCAAALLLALGSTSVLAPSAVAQTDPQAQTPPPTAVVPASQPVVVGPAPAPPPPVYATAAGPAQPYYAPQDVPPRPGSGTGFLVAGWIILGVGAVNLLTAPICMSEEIFGSDEEIMHLCLGLSLGVGITAVVIAIPMLVIGYDRRSKVMKWREQYGELPGVLRHVRLSVTPHAASVGWQASF